MDIRPAATELEQLAEFQRRQKVSLVCLVVSELADAQALKRDLGDLEATRILRLHDQTLRDLLRQYPAGLEVSCHSSRFLLVFEQSSDATRFAVALQARIQELGRTLGPHLAESIGIHVGEVLVESQPGKEGTPILNGLQLDLAEALQKLAEPGRILLTRFASDSARRALKSATGSETSNWFWQEHGWYQAEGFGETVEVCEVSTRLRDSPRPPAGTERMRRVQGQPDLSTFGDEEDRSLWTRLRYPSARQRRSAWQGTALVAFLGVIALISRVCDGPSYDLAYQFKPEEAPDEVVVVEIDEASMKELKQRDLPSWDRKLHARLLEILRQSGVKAVGFDILFDTESDAESDARLQSALRTSGPIVLGAGLVGTATNFQIFPPHPKFRELARWGLAEHGDRSQPIRQPFGGLPTVANMGPLLAELGTGQRLEIPPRAWLKYYGPPGTIPHQSLAAVLAHEIPSNTFAGKWVLVGGNLSIPTLANSGPDFFPSPYRFASPRLMPGVEINATSLLNLLRGDWLRRLGPTWEFLLTLISGAALGYLSVFSSPRQALIGGALLASAVSLVGLRQVWATGIWIPWLVFSGVQVPTAVLWSWLSHLQRLTEKERQLQDYLRARPPSPAPQNTGSTPASAGDVNVPAMRHQPEASPIPDHELIRIVGRGAYGEVWLARDVLGNFHAVKIVREERFPEVGPYEREFRGLQKYTPISRAHPGLVHILHVGRNTAARFFFYIMEAADDQERPGAIQEEQYRPRNLGSELARAGGLAPEKVLDYAIQLSEALAFLHRQGLVHRDLKPSNIIFVQGRPKIADIGLVTEIDAEGSFAGTPGFIPPEGPGRPSADLYSLGRLLYLALSGLTFEQFPQWPTRLRQDLPPDRLERLEEVILRACEPIATDRFQTAEELLDALRECQPTAPLR